MKARVAILVVAVVLIAAAVFAAYVFKRHSKPSSNTVTPQVSESSTPAGSDAPKQAGTPVSAANAAAQCATTDLALTLDQSGGGTAGTTYRQAILTNQSSKSCTIGGFPGVSLVDADDQQLGKPAARTGAARSTITLAPGKAAAAAIGFPNPGNFPGGTCTEESFNLKLYPPGQTTALTAALQAQACPGFSVQSLHAE